MSIRSSRRAQPSTWCRLVYFVPEAAGGVGVNGAGSYSGRGRADGRSPDEGSSQPSTTWLGRSPPRCPACGAAPAALQAARFRVVGRAMERSLSRCPGSRSPRLVLDRCCRRRARSRASRAAATPRRVPDDPRCAVAAVDVVANGATCTSPCSSPTSSDHASVWCCRSAGPISLRPHRPPGGTRRRGCAVGTCASGWMTAGATMTPEASLPAPSRRTSACARSRRSAMKEPPGHN